MAEQDTSRASSEPRVAVVVPTYNEADNLPELSRRLFALGIGDLRLYVVDDGSPDGTAEVARALSNAMTVASRSSPGRASRASGQRT